MKLFRFIMLLVCLTCTGALTFAQEAPASGFRAELLRQYDDVTGKLIELADAVPAEKYSWRPAEGVRSVSEVYVHTSAGNYFLMKFIGIEAPPEFSRDMEKNITDKAGVIDSMKKSFEHLRQAVLKTSDADLEKGVELFGQNTTYRDVFFTAGMHLHEHLGQSIAYARMNGIVPPWSAKQN